MTLRIVKRSEREQRDLPEGVIYTSSEQWVFTSYEGDEVWDTPERRARAESMLPVRDVARMFERVERSLSRVFELGWEEQRRG